MPHDLGWFLVLFLGFPALAAILGTWISVRAEREYWREYDRIAAEGRARRERLYRQRYGS
jgi:hypothetical protein